MGYIYQAPKEFDDQSAKFKKKFPSMAAMLATGDYIVQVKYDGVFAVTMTAQDKMESRQQTPYLSAMHLVPHMTNIFGKQHLVFKELWTDGWEHKRINGASRQHDPEPGLDCRVFDVITVDEFNAGKCAIPYEERYEALKEAIAIYGHPQVRAADQCPITHFNSDEEVLYAARMAQNSGTYDGLIIRDRKAIWTPGASKNGEAVKVKPPITLDLRIIAQHAEQRETKLGGHITVEYKGKPTNVGGGLTQEDLEGIMLWNAGHTSNPRAKNFVDKIGEIVALAVTEAGKLREPRLKCIRHDSQREEDK